MIQTVLQGSLHKASRDCNKFTVGWASAGLLTMGVKVPFCYQQVNFRCLEHIVINKKNLHRSQTRINAFVYFCKH